MLKSDQSVLRLELEEGKPKPNQITYTPRCWPMTHTTTKCSCLCVCVCVGVCRHSCQGESFGFPPLNGAQQLLGGQGGGSYTNWQQPERALQVRYMGIYVLKQPI